MLTDLVRKCNLTDYVERHMLADAFEEQGKPIHAQFIRQYEIDLECHPEHTPVQGNVLASADEGENREAEEWVYSQLESGNQWAWCSVRVCVRWWHDGELFEDDAWLACCSYRSEEDFTDPSGGYYQDMVFECVYDLLLELDEIG